MSKSLNTVLTDFLKNLRKGGKLVFQDDNKKPLKGDTVFSDFSERINRTEKFLTERAQSGSLRKEKYRFDEYKIDVKLDDKKKRLVATTDISCWRDYCLVDIYDVEDKKVEFLESLGAFYKGVADIAPDGKQVSVIGQPAGLEDGSVGFLHIYERYSQPNGSEGWAMTKRYPVVKEDSTPPPTEISKREDEMKPIRKLRCEHRQKHSGDANNTIQGTHEFPTN